MAQLSNARKIPGELQFLACSHAKNESDLELEFLTPAGLQPLLNSGQHCLAVPVMECNRERRSSKQSAKFNNRVYILKRKVGHIIL